MREKLIEVLEKALPGRSEREYLADYLLANGVIVPPCRVGDACFYLRPYKGGKIVVEGVVDDATHTMNGGWMITVKAIKSHFRGWLGDTVFLSRKEAEKALEGRKV